MRNLSLILFFLGVCLLQGQDKFYVKKIVFVGNEKTKLEIIARELTFSAGSVLDTSLISYNENRVYGTGLFNKVKIWFEKDSDNTAIVYVWVNERWYIWPFPILGWKDRDIKKLYYGAGLIHTNFRGRNEKLIFSFALGYDPWIEVEYQNPWVLGSKNLFYSFEALYQRVKNRSRLFSASFYEEHTAINFTLGKRFGLYKKFWTTSGFRKISIANAETSQPIDLGVEKTISPSGKDEIFMFGFGFRYDTRDIPIYPNQGFLFSIFYRYNQLLNFNASFLQGGVEVQMFKKFALGLIAGRLFILNSFGRKIPVYSHYYFGYDERIRGYFNDVFEGENIFAGTLEYRIPVIKQRFFKWEKAPIEEFSILKFGVDFAIFGDIGRTWFNGENVLKIDYLKGYGVELNFILPYDLLFGVGYALNNAGGKQIFVDLRAGFE